MKNAIYISRNYVEIGPFLPAEILDFHKRGILGNLDHVREKGTEDWLLIDEWIALCATPSEPSVKPPVKPAARKSAPAAAKKASAKKAG